MKTGELAMGEKQNNNLEIPKKERNHLCTEQQTQNRSAKETTVETGVGWRGEGIKIHHPLKICLTFVHWVN